MPRGPGCFLGIGVGPVGFEFHAASLSSLSAPRMTILSASSGSGRCNAFASSHGARIHTSRSSSVVRITGMAVVDQPKLPWLALGSRRRLSSGMRASKGTSDRSANDAARCAAHAVGPLPVAGIENSIDPFRQSQARRRDQRQESAASDSGERCH
jgi:hypothetical protein